MKQGRPLDPEENAKLNRAADAYMHQISAITRRMYPTLRPEQASAAATYMAVCAVVIPGGGKMGSHQIHDAIRALGLAAGTMVAQMPGELAEVCVAGLLQSVTDGGSSLPDILKPAQGRG